MGEQIELMHLTHDAARGWTNPNYPDHIIAHIDSVVGLMQSTSDQHQHQTHIAHDRPIGEPIEGIPTGDSLVWVQTEQAAIETEMCLE